MSGALKHTLVRRNPGTLEATVLLAGSEVPDWAKDLVHADNLESATKAKAAKTEDDKSEDGSPSDSEGSTPPAKKAAAKKAPAKKTAAKKAPAAKKS